MAKLKNKLSISNNSRRKLFTVLYTIVCILIYSWGIVAGLELSLNCYIVDTNNSNVTQDIKNGTLSEVAVVYKDGSFVLEGSSKEISSEKIKGYIRVPSGTKYYYNKETKEFVSALTESESRKLILKFLILDILCFVITVVMFVKNINKNLLRRVLICMLFILSAFFSWCIYEFAFEVLFNLFGDSKYVILSKIFIFFTVYLVLLIKDLKTTKLKKR